MSAQPFSAMLDYLKVTPASRWGAMLASLGSTLALLLLIPIFYLFVDLLVHRGRIPEWPALPAEARQKFRVEWDTKLLDVANFKTDYDRLFPNRTHQDVLSWWAANEGYLRTHVSPAAAERFIPAEPIEGQTAHTPSQETIGLLASVAHHRGSGFGAILGWFLRWNTWAWHNNSALVGLFLLSLLLVIGRGVLLNLGTTLASNAAIDATVRIRRSIYSHSQRLGSLATHPEAQADAGDVMTRRTELLQEGFIAWLTVRVRAPLLAAGCVLLLFVVHAWLAIATLFLGSAVWLLAGHSIAWFRRDARLALRRSESRLAVLRENLGLMKLIKAYLMERFNQTRVERHLRDLRKTAKRQLRADIVSRPILYTVGTITGLTMAFVAGRVALSGGISLAGLATLGLLLGSLAMAVNRWIFASVQVSRAHEAAEIVQEFLDRRADAAQPIDAEFLKPLTKKLELVELSYLEPGTGRMILDSISLSAVPGTRTAIYCSQPIEAHTLAHLLTRFVEPTGGEIRFDGKNTRWVTFESLRTQIALVLQDSLTFSDTVANNIGCGEASFTLPQIIEAAKKAHAHQFVQRLPYGYETMLGDSGHSLRPGERFRLALARALLRDPSIYVLEEPAEPYDSDSVALISDTLSRIQPNRAILILARRNSTAKTSDRVVVISHGKISANGQHDQVHVGSEVHKALTTRPT